MTVRKYDHEGRLISEDTEKVQPDGDLEESLESLLRRTEADLKGHFPMMVDSVTRLDAVTIDSDRLHYHYALLNASVEELDVEATRSALTPMVRQQAQSMSFLKHLMERGATLSFHYTDRDGREITVIDLRGGDPD